jgi:DNA-binding response OmpR family regulator
MAVISVISPNPKLAQNMYDVFPNQEIRHHQRLERAAHAANILILDFERDDKNLMLICREARLVAPKTLIIGLLNQHSRMQIPAVLDSGCDDCIRQPYTVGELAARIRAMLRRASVNDSPELVLDETYRSVSVAGREVDLTGTEYNLLHALCNASGGHLSATDLLTQVWHYPPGNGDPALVRNHIRNLRRKLERDPERPRIVTSAHGRGYTIGIDFEKRG